MTRVANDRTRIRWETLDFQNKLFLGRKPCLLCHLNACGGLPGGHRQHYQQLLFLSTTIFAMIMKNIIALIFAEVIGKINSMIFIMNSTTVSNHHLCHAYNQKFPFDPHRNNPQALSRPPAEFPTIVCKIFSLELHALFGVSFGGPIMIIDHHCIVRIVMIMLMM